MATPSPLAWKENRKQELLAKANNGVLSVDEQDELAATVGKRRQDLPLAMRGGLMGVFFGREEKGE